MIVYWNDSMAEHPSTSEAVLLEEGWDFIEKVLEYFLAIPRLCYR